MNYKKGIKTKSKLVLRTIKEIHLNLPNKEVLISDISNIIKLSELDIENCFQYLFDNHKLHKLTKGIKSPKLKIYRISYVVAAKKGAKTILKSNWLS